MSEPLSIDVDAMLARLAVLDMAAAEHAHARLLATEETKAVAELGRTYQRMARSVRQTLAALAKVRADAQAAQRHAATWAPRSVGPRPYFGTLTDKADLEEAALVRIRAEYDPSEAEILEEDVSDFIDGVWDDDFAGLASDDQLTRLMARIRLATAQDEAGEADDADEDPAGDGNDDPDLSSPVGGGGPPGGGWRGTKAAETSPANPAPQDSPPATEEESAEPAAAEIPEPEPPPTPPDPEPWPKPYIPPWEINPYARYPGGSGY